MQLRLGVLPRFVVHVLGWHQPAHVVALAETMRPANGDNVVGVAAYKPLKLVVKPKHIAAVGAGFLFGPDAPACRLGLWPEPVRWTFFASAERDSRSHPALSPAA